MLERIAEVIRQDPSATAKDIAKKLGYSEEKSIYYWLEKGQFKGLRDFRQAVLTGRFPTRQYIVDHSGQSAREGEGGYTLHNVPVVASFSPAGAPVYTGGTVSNLVPTSQGTYGFLLGAPDYSPVLCKGDILLVDPAARPSPGDLMLVLRKDSPGIVRYYPVGSGALLVHPADPASASVAPQDGFTILGRISAVIRCLVPSC
ncbi:MAG: hypothetical protein ACM3X4_06630 [Ignavibacteriales bacterium]